MMRMSDLGLRISEGFRRTAPDPFVIAILLTLLTAVLALVFGDFALEEDQTPFTALLDAWRTDEGLWRFLAFSMQMCLILVTGHAVAVTRPVRRMIDALAGIPQSTASAAFLIGFCAAFAGLLNWGLGLIVGAFLARDVGRSLHRRGVRAHYPLLCASGYIGLLVWHGGLSGSAPFSMTTRDGAAKVIPEQYLDRVAAEGVPLFDTVLSIPNAIISGGLLLGIPLLLMLLAPKREENIEDIGAFNVDEDIPTEPQAPPATAPERLDRSPVVAWLLAIALVAALVRYVGVTGIGSVGLNEINVAMLAIGLILHASPRSYMEAATDGARGCAGIIIQFPLYAGIMGMMAEAGLIEKVAGWFNSIGNETTIPLLSFVSAGVVNLFVPSGGGQWGIQGPVALETGLAAGVEPGRMIMAVAYGDQLTNMLQPFWALPLLAITGVRARDIVGYTSIIMVAAAAWITLGLLIL